MKINKPVVPYYKTAGGVLYKGSSEHLLKKLKKKYAGKVKLIFTSPPFPLNRKKKYGNLTGDEYLKWIAKFSKLFSGFLTQDGSIVIEIGNAWNSGIPTTSTLPMETLLHFKNCGKYHLCQEFIYYNPARLPSPVQWVNIERIRVKDAFTRFWWLSKTPFPDANNSRILIPYGKKMLQLLNSKKYNAGKRPSEHTIGEKSFCKNNNGAIPPNVIIASNTTPYDNYITYCRNNNFEIHPARMPDKVVELFIKFLTKKNDIVLDPFAGSNVTGATSERLGRKWLSIEVNENYIKGSIGRFTKRILK